jgi:hypothetical protein
VLKALKNLFRRKRKKIDARQELIEGRLNPPTDYPSLLFFTVHKAASSFGARLLQEIAAANEICSIDFDNYLFAGAGDKTSPTVRQARPLLAKVFTEDEFGPTPEQEARFRNLFLPKGCLYAAIRRPPLLHCLPHLDQFRAILLLRDPRDCLTSLFYSVAYSHRPPGDPDKQPAFFEYRDQVREMKIDRFVLAHGPEWCARYQQFCSALQKHDNVHLLTYEQLVLDFPGWIDRVLEIWGVDVDIRVRRKLMRMGRFDVEKEDVHSHKRQVQPGDHRRKLKPETIEEITEMFRPVLVPLNYETDRSAAAKVA